MVWFDSLFSLIPEEKGELSLNGQAYYYTLLTMELFFISRLGNLQFIKLLNKIVVNNSFCI